MKSFFLKLTATIFLLALSGCATSSPEDFHVEKLSLVKVSTDTKKEIDYGRYVDVDGSFYRLRLELTSSTDLVDLAGDYSLRYTSYLCDRPEYKVLIGSNALYSDGENVQGLGLSKRYGSTEIPERIFLKEPKYKIIQSAYKVEKRQSIEKSLNSDGTDKRHAYTMYLGLYSPAVASWRKNSEGSYQNEFEAYDLKIQPEDVCIVIEGHAKLGGGFKSNVVKVDRQLFKDVLNGVE